jgi:hypothetical protein
VYVPVRNTLRIIISAYTISIAIPKLFHCKKGFQIRVKRRVTS